MIRPFSIVLFFGFAFVLINASCMVRSANGAYPLEQDGAKKIFKEWDRNGDGVLVQSEVPVGPRQNFKKVDRNGDGKVTIEEHLAFLRNETPNRGSDEKKGSTDRNSTFPNWPHAKFETLEISQKWHQEPKGFQRQVLVSQPRDAKGKLPVLISFHGAGGNAMGSMRQWRAVSKRMIIVSPQGYRKTWNIHGEPSEAPDVEFFRKLSTKLKNEIPSADWDDVSVVGFSNGCGFINRLMIEIEDPFAERYFLMSSSLIEEQFHDGKFWKPSKSTAKYDTPVSPNGKRRIYYFHGTNDRVVPYRGGKRSRRFPHVSAQETTLAWAKAAGYRGEKLDISKGKKINNSIIKLTYPKTQVTHFQVIGGNHGLEPHRERVTEMILELIRE